MERTKKKGLTRRWASEEERARRLSSLQRRVVKETDRQNPPSEYHLSSDCSFRPICKASPKLMRSLVRTVDLTFPSFSHSARAQLLPSTCFFLGLSSLRLPRSSGHLFQHPLHGLVGTSLRSSFPVSLSPLSFLSSWPSPNRGRETIRWSSLTGSCEPPYQLYILFSR